MDVESLVRFLSKMPSVSDSFPFDEDTMVFKVGSKMFALIALNRYPLAINLKCDPDRAQDLRESYAAITPGFHMNKKHWNTVEIGEIEDRFLLELIQHSYDLVVEKMTKKERVALGI